MPAMEYPPSSPPAPPEHAEHATGGADPTAVVAPDQAAAQTPNTETDHLPAPDWPAPGEPAAPPAEPPAALPNPFRYWGRSLVLALLVVILLALRQWDEARVPTRPLRPDVLLATPVPGATVSAADPSLNDTMLRLRTALLRRDTRALGNLADPEGLIVAAYGGEIPDTGYRVADPARLSQDILAGAQISLRGWRSDSRGRVLALTFGWQARPLRLSPNSTLEITDVTGLGLVNRAGTWYWRWLLPDASDRRVLSQQAQSLSWQPWPA